MIADRKIGIGALLAAMLLVGITFVPMVSASFEKTNEQQMPEKTR